ncbi:MAG TPA: heme-binding domain-containing protein [Vicinamibacterales bacterium]|nr:heme-binding domain-containing protein [Vicinamibacterales bacterium]
MEMMFRRVTKAIVWLFALFLAIQMIRPARTNPPVDPARTLEAHVEVPPEVEAILTRSCADCHTNRTRWPWYSNVAPASWLVVNDVNEGRRHMNLSDWEQRHRHEGSPFDEICKQVRDGEMPLWYYTPLHPETRLSPGDVQTICAWTAGPPRDRRP